MKMLFNLFQPQAVVGMAPPVAASPDSMANRGAPPDNVFGSSISFGGTGEPISQREAVHRIRSMHLAYNGADRHGITMFDNGRISAAGLGYYHVVGKPDASGKIIERALLFALRPQHLYVGEQTPGSAASFHDTAYLVNVGKLDDGCWPDIYPDLLRHSVEARRVLAANMLFRTGVGIYQSATVSYRMIPAGNDASGEAQVKVQLFSRDYRDEKFEPTDMTNCTALQRFLKQPFVLGTVPYRDAERGIAADFARRQERIMAGKDPLTFWERAKNPRQIARRFWSLGESEMKKNYLHDWSNPKVIATNLVRVLVGVAKFVLSGAGSLLEKGIEGAGHVLGSLVDPDRGYREYFLRSHSLLRKYAKPHPAASFLNHVLLPLNEKAFNGFRPLTRDEAEIAPYAAAAPGEAPLDPHNDILEYFRQPYSAPGSLVKFWKGKGGHSSITFQRPSGIRFDYLIAPDGKQLEGIYARYLPDWRVEEAPISPARAWAELALPLWLQKGLGLQKPFNPHPIAPEIAALFEPGKVLRVLEVSNGKLWSEQVSLEEFERNMLKARTGNQYEEGLCLLTDRPQRQPTAAPAPSRRMASLSPPAPPAPATPAAGPAPAPL